MILFFIYLSPPNPTQNEYKKLALSKILQNKKDRSKNEV